jgi:hypothetical protein
VVHIFNYSYSGGGDKRIKNWRAAQTNMAEYPLKNKIQSKRAEGMVQEVECLFSKSKALGSIPSTTERKRKRKKWKEGWKGKTRERKERNLDPYRCVSYLSLILTNPKDNKLIFFLKRVTLANGFNPYSIVFAALEPEGRLYIMEESKWWNKMSTQ